MSVCTKSYVLYHFNRTQVADMGKKVFSTVSKRFVLTIHKITFTVKPVGDELVTYNITIKLKKYNSKSAIVVEKKILIRFALRIDHIHVYIIIRERIYRGFLY